MGMFDIIMIDEAFLPVSEGEKKHLSSQLDNQWQTKDLENNLDTYFINSDRQLLKKMNQEECYPITFTGMLNFYDYDQMHDWWEFQCSFLNGLMIEIKGGNMGKI